MSDAIQVSNVEQLEPEMRSVFNLFSRAANSIINESELSRRVAALTDETKHVNEAFEVLSRQRDELLEKLTFTQTELANSRETVAEQSQRLNEKSTEISSLQSDNTFLSQRLADTTERRDLIRGERDKAWGELEQVRDERNDMAEKLAKFRDILGLPKEEKQTQPVVTYEEPKVTDCAVTYDPPDGPYMTAEQAMEASETERHKATLTYDPDWHDPKPTTEPKPDPWSDLAQHGYKVEGGPDASVVNQYAENFANDKIDHNSY